MPPSRYEGCPTSWASVSKAVVTVGLVQAMLCAASSVVAGRPCGLQVDVLPEVGDGPTDVGAERERGDPGPLQAWRRQRAAAATSWASTSCPATANSAGLYQMVFLLAPLNQTP